MNEVLARARRRRSRGQVVALNKVIIGLRNFAKLAEVDAANLSHWLNRTRNLSPLSLDKLQAAVLKFDQDKNQKLNKE